MGESSSDESIPSKIRLSGSTNLRKVKEDVLGSSKFVTELGVNGIRLEIISNPARIRSE